MVLEVPVSTRLINRNVSLSEGRTSMRLEPEFWQALQEMSTRERRSVSALIQALEPHRDEGGRTSAVRVLVLDYFRQATTEEGHQMAGHGSLG